MKKEAKLMADLDVKGQLRAMGGVYFTKCRISC